VQPGDLSPTARSADVTLARAEQAMPQAARPDRYAIYPSMLQADVAQPGEMVDVERQFASEPNEVASTTDTEPVPLTDTTSTNLQPVARGQEPSDGTIELIEPAADIAQAADATVEVDDEPQEPKTLELPADESTVSAASQRARNAFRDTATTTDDDRYGTAAATPRASTTPTSSSSTTVNPFAAKSAGSTMPAATPQPIEALPTAPSQNAAGLTNQEPTPTFEFTAVPAEPMSSGAPPIADNTASGAGASDGTGRPGERALEGPQKPALLIQKFAPGEIQVGKPAKFVVQVRNAGSQPADDVIVRDEVPQGTRLISTTPSAAASGNQLIWQLGKLSAGEERSLEMQLMPVAEGEVGSVATVSYSAQASVKTRCTMPQLAIRMTAPEKVMIGQEQRVKIELRNPGSGDATGVMLFENVPENVKHAAGPALEFEIGTLRAGETRELELSLLAEKAGKVVNVLTARADGNLQVQQQVEFEVIAPALAVSVDGPERRYLERPATYEVSVENPGTAPAHDVQIVTKLPKGMRFVRANNMGEYDAATHAVYWSLTELPEGESGTVELVTMPVETGTQTLAVESRAGQGLADQTEQQIVVEGLAAIMFEVRDLEDPIEVGRETGYEIRVVNQGTKAATNVQVAVNLPPGLRIVSAEGETGHATQGANLVFEPLPQLAPKADTLYRLRVQGVQAGDQRVTVQVNTDDIGQPIRREESTRVFGDE